MPTRNKEAQKRHNQTYYRRNKERYVERSREQRAVIRKILLEAKAAGCSRCPERDPVCMDFHHRDGSEKDQNVSLAVRRGWSPARVLAEIAKCDLLCSNCHRKLHAEQRIG